MTYPTVSPLSHLLPYQQKWVQDRSRFKIGLWARQTGKSTACAVEIINDCLRAKNRQWLVVSAGERQAVEFLEKVKLWSAAYDFAFSHYAEDRTSARALLRQAEIRWPNGSRVIALPANPRTIRGYSGNIVLDEFAFYEAPEALWRALYPTITNSLTGGQKLLRIVTTPNGPGNPTHQLWSRSGNHYSKHKVTIHDAIAAGLPVHLDELRAGLGHDPVGWAQEYECEFIDQSSTVLPYELIARCEHPHVHNHLPWPRGNTRWSGGPLFMGIDFARKNDRTIAWTFEKRGDLLWSREILELQNLDTLAQFEILRPRLPFLRRVALDATGAGTGLGDLLTRKLHSRLDALHFSVELKHQLFTRLRLAFEQRHLRIPAQPVVREDLHSWHRQISPETGRVTYQSPHSPQGHGDRAIALALALHAAENYRSHAGPVICQSLGRFHPARRPSFFFA